MTYDSVFNKDIPTSASIVGRLRTNIKIMVDTVRQALLSRIQNLETRDPSFEKSHNLQKTLHTSPLRANQNQYHLYLPNLNLFENILEIFPFFVSVSLIQQTLLDGTKTRTTTTRTPSPPLMSKHAPLCDAPLRAQLSAASRRAALRHKSTQKRLLVWWLARQLHVVAGRRDDSFSRSCYHRWLRSSLSLRSSFTCSIRSWR